MSNTVYYEMVKRVISYNPNAFATAAVWSCSLCNETIAGMGGPGNGEICEKCGNDILHGHLKYKREV